MATIDPNDQYAAPDPSPAAVVPLLMREVQFLNTLEKRLQSVMDEEARCCVSVCSDELGAMQDLCVEAMARIGAALAIRYPLDLAL
jgi:hypothetical protein